MNPDVRSTERSQRPHQRPQLALQMRESRTQLLPPSLAFRFFDFADDARPRGLDPLALLVQLDLLDSPPGLLLRFLRGLGLEPLLLNPFHFVSARHRCYSFVAAGYAAVVVCVAYSQRATPSRRSSGRSSAVRKRSFIIFSAASVNAPRY